MPLQFKTCIKLTAWGLWPQINQWANISSLVTLSACTQTHPTDANLSFMQLVKQVILLIYHKVWVSLEQSQIFTEINNNLFNESKLSGFGLSLMLMEIYLFLFKVIFFFFFCSCGSFLLLLAERFSQSWEHRLSLKGGVKKWSHVKSSILSRVSLYDMSTSFIAMTVTTLLQDGRCGYFHFSDEYKAQGILSGWSQATGNSCWGQKPRCPLECQSSSSVMNLLRHSVGLLWN